MKVKPRITIARYDITQTVGTRSINPQSSRTKNWVYFSTPLCFLDFNHKIRSFLGYQSWVEFDYSKSYRLLNR